MTQRGGPSRFDVAIVGAGAAGLATGIFLARAAGGNAAGQPAAPPRTVAVLDGARKPGAKILISGGGRCNVTNAAVTADDFRGGNRHFIRNVLRAFTAGQAAAFFREIGVALHEEEDGKLFPDTHKARTVLDALMSEAGRLGVRILPDQRVTDIRTGVEGASAGFTLACRTAEGATGEIFANRVVLATGGLSLPKTGSDGGGYEIARRLGHSIVPTTPALAPLVLHDEIHAGLSGVAHPAELALNVAGEKTRRFRGRLLWTHFGISGPAALDASGPWHRARLAGKPAELTTSFAPGTSAETADRYAVDWAASHARASVRAAVIALCSRGAEEPLPARVAEAMLTRNGIPSNGLMAQLDRELRGKLIRSLLAWPLPVIDSRGFAHAEVTAGGVALDEVDYGTMESRVCPGLHLVGEILDVDGRLGGFNFQWAWSTGFVAGGAIARMWERP